MLGSINKLALAGLLVFSASTASHALSDQEALAEGMIPIEEYTMNEMRAVLTPGLTSEGVAHAARTHRLVIAINKAAKGKDAQTLRIIENGVEVLKEKISTGREKQETAKSGRVYFSTTPKGFFRPTKIYKDYMSYTWKAPMPNAVFFVGGIAIHATGKASYPQLGTRASGGCVRTKLELSQLIRKKVMEAGLGSSVGQYKLVTESEGRTRVTRNSVLVDEVSRATGELLRNQVQSWDAVIVVYEE